MFTFNLRSQYQRPFVFAIAKFASSILLNLTKPKLWPVILLFLKGMKISLILPNIENRLYTQILRIWCGRLSTKIVGDLWRCALAPRSPITIHFETEPCWDNKYQLQILSSLITKKPQIYRPKDGETSWSFHCPQTNPRIVTSADGWPRRLRFELKRWAADDPRAERGKGNTGMERDN